LNVNLRDNLAAGKAWKPLIRTSDIHTQYELGLIRYNTPCRNLTMVRDPTRCHRCRRDYDASMWRR
jgi:hypothetical protein